MIRKLLLLSSLFSLLTNSGFSQQNNIVLKQLWTDPRTQLPRYAEIDTDLKITEDQFFLWLNSTYKIPDGSTFLLWRSDADDLGFIHNKYKQYYKGIEVLHAMLIVHIKHGFVESFNGEYFNRFENQTPITGAVAARDMVIQSFGEGVVFRWQDPQQEKLIKDIKKDANATWFPTKINEYYSYAEGYDGKTPLVRCYGIQIALSEPFLHEEVLVNAVTGKMFRTIAQEIHGDSLGKAVTHYEGTKDIITEFIMKDSFRLRESAKRNILTYKASLGTDYFDKDNYWNNGTEKIAADIHYGAELVHDFMHTFFKRKSYDSKGGSITSIGSAGSGNAFWNLSGNYATFLVGTSSGVGPCASLDVVGHEFGHGIADENAGLVYTGEACSLHESFADITGHMIEFVNDSAKANWDLGEKVWTGSKGIRNMENPHLFKDPKAYGGQYYPKGCHGSGGVQNYWFYIMTNGDTATNEFSYAYSLKGLGHWKAAQITYRSYFYYIIPNSTFKDAMKGAIKAAKDLYGSCSNELEHTYKAWKAVNVEDTSVKTVDLSHGIKAPTLLCAAVPAKSTLDCYGDMSRTVSWLINNKDTSSQRTWMYQFNNTGKYSVKLTTNTCGKSFVDSMYIIVNHNPKPEFQKPFDSACLSNSPFTFTNTTVNADKIIPLHYYWYVNPGSYTDTTKDLSVKLEDPIDYEVTLKAYYQGGCWNTTKKMVTILERPRPKFEVLKDVCQGRELRLRNLTDTSANTVHFTWTFPDLTTYNGFEPKTKTLPNSGIFDVILKATFSFGNCSDTAMRKIKILPNPKPDFTWSNPCRNLEMTTTAGGTSSAGKAWNQWHLGTYNPINKDILTFNAGDSASRTIGFTLADTLGCVGRIHKTISLGTLNVQFSASDVCLGDSTKIATSISSDIAPTLQWDLGNGDSKTGALPSYLFAKSGNYQIHLTAKNSNCQVKLSDNAIVKPTPKLQFEFQNICHGDTAIFTNTSDGLDSITFHWNFGDNKTFDGVHAKHMYEIGATKTVNVTLKGTGNNSCSAQFVKAISVIELPNTNYTAEYDINAGNNGYNFKPSVTNLHRYSWHFGNGDSSNLVTPFYRFKSNGKYVTLLKGWNAAGCFSQTAVEVDAAFSGLNEPGGMGIHIYPNPASDYVYIEIPSGLHGTFEVTDLRGCRIIHGNLETAIHPLNMAELPPAVYQLRIGINGQYSSYKLIRN